MRNQALRRTTLFSLIGLKSALAQEPSWGTPFSVDPPSTTNLLESSSPLSSAATSTESLAPTPTASLLTSDATLVSETSSPLISSVTLVGETATPQSSFASEATAVNSLPGSFSFTVSLPTPSGSPSTISVPIPQIPTTSHVFASRSGTASRELRSRSKTDSTAAATSTDPASNGGAVPTKYVKMGFAGVLGAAAALIMA